MSEQTTPYKTLGQKLKEIREHSCESLAEVSGAVELDEKTLRRIENGLERPSEDILLLLISHFGVQDDSAAELWQLAGYDRERAADDDQQAALKAAVMVMVDPRVMYSDSIEVTANQQGIVLNFAQTNGANNPLTVARIGMSHDQAKIVMGVLHQVLYDLDQPKKPRELGDGKTSA